VALTSFKNWLPALACAIIASLAQASDADILAARDAAQRGNLKALESLRAKTAGHLLGAYPAYWHLLATLDKAPPEEIRRFMAAHADGPLADQLRREWLRRLGAAGQWDSVSIDKLASMTAYLTLNDNPHMTPLPLWYAEQLVKMPREVLSNYLRSTLGMLKDRAVDRAWLEGVDSMDEE
jgi:hypothetical protein